MSTCELSLFSGCAWSGMFKLSGELLASLMPTLSYLLAAAVIGAVLSAVSSLAALIAKRFGVSAVSPMLTTGTTLVFGTLGVILGLAVGLARESIIGDVSTVLLGGAGILFSLAVVKSGISTLMAGLIAITFAFSFYLGGQVGATDRDLHLARLAKGSSESADVPVVNVYFTMPTNEEELVGEHILDEPEQPETSEQDQNSYQEPFEAPSVCPDSFARGCQGTLEQRTRPEDYPHG